MSEKNEAVNEQADVKTDVQQAADTAVAPDNAPSAMQGNAPAAMQDIAPAAMQGGESMEELLRQILEADKKEVKYAKRAAFFTMGLFLIFLVAAIIIVPKVIETLSHVNNAVITADQTLVSANEAIGNINKMSASITDTSDSMNTMLSDNSKSLTDAVSKMNNIDFEGLNQAIQDLQDAVGPFATFMNRFK